MNGTKPKIEIFKPFGEAFELMKKILFQPFDLKKWIIIGLVVILLFLWLKARGNFVFTDCIVRNRGTIVEPWREYRKEGNSYFGFILAVAFGSMIVFAIMFVLFAALGLIDFGHGKTTPVTSIGALVFLFLFGFLFVVFVNVLTYFMPL